MRIRKFKSEGQARPRWNTRLGFHADVADVGVMLLFQHIRMFFILKRHEREATVRPVAFSHHFNVSHRSEGLHKMSAKLRLILVCRATDEDLAPSKISRGCLARIAVRHPQILWPLLICQYISSKPKRYMSNGDAHASAHTFAHHFPFATTSTVLAKQPSRQNLYHIRCRPRTMR